MRDAATHLLSISGLHVSAVIACVYLLAIRLLRCGRGCACGCGYRFWRPGSRHWRRRLHASDGSRGADGAELPRRRAVLLALALGANRYRSGWYGGSGDRAAAVPESLVASFR